MNSFVKLKEPSVVRTYDQDGFRKRASCVCVNEDETKVLLVTSRKDPSLWIVPGGGVEPDELAPIAAVREVKEEAGVCGKLSRCLGVFENKERRHRTSVFVMEVTEELEEWDESRSFGRQRQWFTVEAAVSALHKPLQSNYVKLLLPPSHRYHTCPPHPHVEPISSSPDAVMSSADTHGDLIDDHGQPSSCHESLCKSNSSGSGTDDEHNHHKQCAAPVPAECKEPCQLMTASPGSSSLTASMSTG
ncbi:hypothetical protein HAZT_HAZT006123 [Hyalella azteca]|uniref:diphosphoinositol-polyphosphate diphosphatase n=1 Tax=Hyalella azteca TaxID=294128 RepID=A0A6A0H1K1_HYAAZ|nr:diphosphoinositol polyphosphate phosphohydrolase 1 [Hyalella azteca]KAA0195474.1 hypothetical protein HAZT_HAZT006123 [Hyalella azteca]